MRTAHGGIGRRSVLRWIGRIAAASAVAIWRPGAFAEAATAKAQPTRRTVVLDPGHGGIDPGAIGVTGAYEKEITLSTVELAAGLLEATRRYKVVLTRRDDEFIALEDRVAHARAARGDLFLSVHADAIPDSGVRGASVFTLSEHASDAEAAALAQRENRADLIAGIDLSRHTPEVSSILLDLARRQTNNQSIVLARKLVAELGRDVRLLNNSHRSAGFVVLKAPDIPSALVELGCLSNKDEEKLLRLATYQRKLAVSILRSVNDYFDQAGVT
ncbi:MAG TPA: N-acetylmuramoyl-L-alanine amidase [Stellaceae bacterium]|nr:N-acetylmuramoyl-L-alanine amidase [Stellaceae bacterium]